MTGDLTSFIAFPMLALAIYCLILIFFYIDKLMGAIVLSVILLFFVGCSIYYATTTFNYGTAATADMLTIGEVYCVIYEGKGHSLLYIEKDYKGSEVMNVEKEIQGETDQPTLYLINREDKDLPMPFSCFTPTTEGEFRIVTKK